MSRLACELRNPSSETEVGYTIEHLSKVMVSEPEWSVSIPLNLRYSRALERSNRYSGMVQYDEGCVKLSEWLK